MFNNIGGKIKILATVICILGIAGSIISGFSMFTYAEYDEVFVFYGLLIMILGSLFSWIGCFFLYGFGELIDSTQENNQELKAIKHTLKTLSTNAANEQYNRNGGQTDITSNSSASFYCGKCGASIPSYPCRICGHTGKGSPAHIPIRVTPNEFGYITCPVCGLVQEKVNDCGQCGQLFVNGQIGIPFWCAKCGKEGPYFGNCPNCGNNLKIFNNEE